MTLRFQPDRTARRHPADTGTDPTPGDTDLVIEAVGVRKAYGERVALAGLDISVGRGELLGILGPNGAGKTTLLEILEGHRRRDAGSVRVLGRDPARTDASWRARLGIVLQELGAPGQLTVREVARLYAGYYPAPRDVDDVLGLVGLADRSEDRIEHLSGGARRRLDVALGVIGNPELLFLDEPTTGFDPNARRLMWTTIRRLRAEGATIVLTTHYLDEAAALADRLVILRDGDVVANGRPAELAVRGGPPVLRLTVPAGIEPPALTHADFDTEDSGRLTARLHDPVAALDTIGRWAATTGCDLADLTITRPSLEDIYLELLA